MGLVVTGLGRTRRHPARFSGRLPAFAEGIAAQCLHPAGAAVSFSAWGSGADPVAGHLLCAPAAGTFRGPGSLCFPGSELHRPAEKRCPPQAAAHSLTEAVDLFQETLTHQRCKIKAL